MTEKKYAITIEKEIVLFVQVIFFGKKMRIVSIDH